MQGYCKTSNDAMRRLRAIARPCEQAITQPHLSMLWEIFLFSLVRYGTLVCFASMSGIFTT